MNGKPIGGQPESGTADFAMSLLTRSKPVTGRSLEAQRAWCSLQQRRTVPRDPRNPLTGVAR